MRALAADLLHVGAGGLVAVMAVGDQQLGVGKLCRHRLVHGGLGDPPDAVQGAVVVGHLAPGVAGGRRLDLPPGVGAGEREDRREVVAGGAGEVEAVLLRPRLGALVGPHSAGPVVLDPHPGEDRVAGEARAVRRRVLLGQRPERRLAVPAQDALQLPVLEGAGGVGVGILALAGLRKVDLDHVEGRAAQQLGPLRGVDDVVGRRGDVLQRADPGEVVVQGGEGLDVGHGAGNATSRLGRVGAWRSLVARGLWVAEVPGSNPGAPTRQGSAVG